VTQPHPDKRVASVELFFDLVFVFAITQVSDVLRADDSWAGLGRALVVFIPIYWAWVGTTMHANLHDVERPLDRLGILTIGLCGLFMALALPGAYHTSGLLFGASYWAARLVLFVLTRRTYRRVGFNSFIAAACISGPLLVFGGLVHGTTRIAVWALAAAIDLAVPYLVRARLVDVPFEPSHLSERYGSFVIIALGESVVATGVAAGHHPLVAVRVAAVAVAFALTCALWYLYFVYSAGAIRDALQSAMVTIEVVRPVLPYGHLGFIAGIIAMSAGIGEVIVDPRAHLPTDVTALLFGGTALYLATFGYTGWRMFRSIGAPRLTTAAICVTVGGVADRVPALAALSILTFPIIALNVTESRLAPLPRHWRRRDTAPFG